MKAFMNKWLFQSTDKWLIQFIRYFFVGGVAALVNILLLFILTDIFFIYYLLSNVLSFIAGLTVNYILSKRLVFYTNFGNKKIEFILYGFIGGIGLVFDTGLIYFFTEIMGIYYLFSKIISTFLVFVWNFLARKFLYLFVEKKSEGF
jgi:putative flippase GtrA